MKKKLLRIFFAFIMFFSVLPTAHIYNNEETPVVAASESVSAYNIWVLNQKGFAYSNNETNNWTANKQPQLVVSSITFDSGYNMEDLKNWCTNYKDDIVEGYYAPDSSKCNYTIVTSSSTSITLRQNTQVWGDYDNGSDTSHFIFPFPPFVSKMTVKVQGYIGSSYVDVQSYTLSSKQFKKIGIWANNSSSKGAWNITSNTSYKETFNYFNVTRKYSAAYGSHAAGENIGTDKKYQYAYYNVPSSPGAITGYTFSSWVTTQGGSTEYSAKSVTAEFSVYAKYNINSYNISYELDGGSASNPSSYNIGTSTFTLNNPTKNGYSFTGWTGSNGTTPQKEITITKGTTGDLNYTANWSPTNYTISYDLDSGSASNPSSYNIETSTFTLNNPTRTGYSFTGWTGSNGTTPQKEVTITKGTTGVLSYKANWSAIKYDVSFDLKGGSGDCPTIEVAYDAQYGTLPSSDKLTPPSEGLMFTGWYTKDGTSTEDWGDEVLSTTIVSTPSDHTLYAQWKELKKYTLTLDPNGAFATIDDNTIQFYENLRYGSLENLTDFPTPTRDGYTFDGWYTEPTGGTKVTVNTKEHPNEDHTIYAHWRTKTYSISYDLDGGSVAIDNPTTYHPESENITLINPIKEGYTFDGWTERIYPLNWYKGFINHDTGAYEEVSDGSTETYYTEKFLVKVGETYTLNGTSLGNKRWEVYNLNGTHVSQNIITGTTYTATQDGYVSILLISETTEENRNAAYITIGSVKDSITIPTGSIGNRTYIANWEANTYTVTLDTQDETAKESFTVTYDSTYDKLPSSAGSKTGYTFAGWYTDPVVGTEVTRDSKVQITDDQTLYAHWTPKTYYAILDDNYADAPVSDSKPVVYDNYFDDIIIPIRNGYTFLGYFTGAKEGTKVIDENGKGVQKWSWTTTNDSPKILYAHWQLNEYTIRYNLQIDGVITTNTTTYTIETETFKLTNPEKYGATFLGWTGSNGATPSTEITIEKGSTGDREYTAQWSGTITFHLDIKNINTATSTWGSIISGYSLRIYNGSAEYRPYEEPPYETRFKQIDGTKFEYYLELSTLGFNQTTDVVLYFYQDSAIKQTTKISLALNVNNLGGHYEIICPTSFTWSGDKINNVKQGEMSFVSYYLPDGTLLTKDYYTPDGTTKYKPIHINRDGTRLEYWYTDISLTNKFESGVTILDGTELTLYGKYLPAEDYYLYIDTTHLTDWSVTSVYLWNSYFDSHDKTWPGNMEAVTNLENGIIQIAIDASKSYNYLILNDGKKEGALQTVDITLAKENVYYIIQNSKDSSGHYNVAVEKDLYNLMTAQKVNGDVNAFRFGAGLSSSITDLSSSNKNFGYKFIFVDKDGKEGKPTSYVGYWNFSTNNKLDALRVGNILYLSKTLDESSSYAGYYALTLTDDVSFKFEDYDQIIVIACYKDTKGDIQVIKAQEYNIVKDDNGNIDVHIVQR